MRPSKPEPTDEAALERAAVDLLARREHSRHELTRKLAARGFDAGAIERVLDELERTGALATSRFVETFVRSRVARGHGPIRIRAELAERGVAGEAAADSLKAAGIDWLEATRAARRKRFGPELPRDYRERARQARFLAYRGFDGAAIKAALEVDEHSE